MPDNHSGAVTIPTVPRSAAASAVRPSRARFVILTLLAVGTIINYLDRSILGIAAPTMTTELGIDPALMGVMFSAFAWSYVLAQVPGGALLDRFGSGKTYFVAASAWSLTTLLHGLVSGFTSLIGLRLLLGVSEATCFPTNSRVVATWFPQQERARATSIYTVGEYIGLAFLSPLLFMLLAHYGWRSLFVLVGVIGLVFAVVWKLRYREPHECTRVNAAELAYIEAGGGLAPKDEKKTPFSWKSLRQLLGFRQIWGACLGQFAGNSTLVFFLTWFPTYLSTERHMGWMKMGIFAVLPFIAAGCGVMLGGWFSDRLIQRTGNASLGRKLPIIAGLLMASCIVAANFVESDQAVIAILSIAFFGQGMVGLGWTVISDIAPKKLIGLTAGVFNLVTGLAGIITPLVIGFIVSSSGSFTGALWFIGAVALAGALAYLLLLGEVKRLEV